MGIPLINLAGWRVKYASLAYLFLIETVLVMQEWIGPVSLSRIMSSNTHSPFKTENFGYENYIMYKMSPYVQKKVSGVK